MNLAGWDDSVNYAEIAEKMSTIAGTFEELGYSSPGNPSHRGPEGEELSDRSKLLDRLKETERPSVSNSPLSEEKIEQDLNRDEDIRVGLHPVERANGHTVETVFPVMQEGEFRIAAASSRAEFEKKEPRDQCLMATFSDGYFSASIAYGDQEDIEYISMSYQVPESEEAESEFDDVHLVVGEDEVYFTEEIDEDELQSPPSPEDIPFTDVIEAYTEELRESLKEDPDISNEKENAPVQEVYGDSVTDEEGIRVYSVHNENRMSIEVDISDLDGEELERRIREADKVLRRMKEIEQFDTDTA